MRPFNFLKFEESRNMYRRRYLLRILVISALFLISIPKPSHSQESDLEKAKVLVQQVVKLYQQGRYADAIPLAKGLWR